MNKFVSSLITLSPASMHTLLGTFNYFLYATCVLVVPGVNLRSKFREVVDLKNI